MSTKAEKLSSVLDYALPIIWIYLTVIYVIDDNALLAAITGFVAGGMTLGLFIEKIASHEYRKVRNREL